MNIKIAFFSEAGSKRGLGHFVRSYTIYCKFKSLGFETDFFLDSDIDLSYQYNDVKHFVWEDFALTDKYDVIFIDSYEANLEIYETISKSAQVAVYLDDYKRLEYPKGIILNFSPDAEEKFYKHKNPLNNYMLGLDYIPIRKMFFKKSYEQKEYLFIMMGGSDVLNLTLQITQYFQDMNIPKVVVVNNQNSAKKLKHFHNTTVLYKPSDETLISYMKRAKLAISTASMSLYELSFLSVPTIIVATSTNQQVGALTLEKHHLAIKCVDIENNNWLADLKGVIQTVLDVNKLTMCKIDGHGTERIVNKIVELLK